MTPRTSHPAPSRASGEPRVSPILHTGGIRSWAGCRAWQGSPATFLSHQHHHVLPKHGGRRCQMRRPPPIQFNLTRRPSQDRGRPAAALSFVPRTTLGSRQHYSANDERGEIASAEERVFSPLFSHFSPTFHPHPIPVERTVRQDPRLALRRLTEPPCCHVQHGSGAVECVPRSF